MVAAQDSGFAGSCRWRTWFGCVLLQQGQQGAELDATRASKYSLPVCDKGSDVP